MGRRARAAVAEMEAFDAAATRRRFEGDVACIRSLRGGAPVHENDAETLRRLLAARGIPDAADERGDTLLSLSCGLGRRGATKALLRRAPTSTPKTPPGSRPWSGASRRDTSNSRISSSSGPNDTACAWETSERAGRGGATSEGDE